MTEPLVAAKLKINFPNGDRPNVAVHKYSSFNQPVQIFYFRPVSALVYLE